MLWFLSNLNCIQDDEVGFAYVSQREARPSLYVDPTFQKPMITFFSLFFSFSFSFSFAFSIDKVNASIRFAATVLDIN